jgi:hypothetical protein
MLLESPCSRIRIRPPKYEGDCMGTLGDGEPRIFLSPMISETKLRNAIPTHFCAELTQ